MTITKEQFHHLIPHSGAMCLLDRVERWDDTTILCVSRTHRDPNNPLRNRGRLSAVCGVEYAAQAMALHGGLVSGRPDTGGYLASVRDLHLLVRYLDNIEAELQIEATRLMGDENSLMYQFSVRAGDAELLGGRALVFLQQTGEKNEKSVGDGG